MIKRKKIFVIGTVVVLVLSTSGCGAKKDTVEGTEHLNIVASNSGVGHIDSIIADEAGYYEKEGLDVDMTYINVSAESIQALTSGKADLVSSGIAAGARNMVQGEDIVVIGGQMTAGSGLFAAPGHENEYKEINAKTIEGKKVGCVRMAIGDVILRAYLKKQGVDLSKIEFVELETESNILTAIEKNELDLGIFSVNMRSMAEESGLKAVLHFDEVWPDYTCCRLFTSKKNIEEKRPALVKAVKANIEAYHLIQTDPDQAIKETAKGVELPEDKLKFYAFDYGHLTHKPNPNLEQVTSFWEGLIDVGYAEGSVEQVKDFIDVTLYEDALQELLHENPDDAIYQAMWEESQKTNH